MSYSITGEFIYENLTTVSQVNAKTRMCFCEPLKKMYVVKHLPSVNSDCCEKIKQITNPHLAKLIHIAKTNDGIEIVSEYIAGDSLTDLLKREHKLSPERAVQIICDVCDGLAALHSVGCVHRDITPNNVIVSSDGRATVIDYDIARIFTKNTAKDTYILGTPGYAAPEQFGFSQSDAKTDIYSVGILLNVLLTGEMPSEKQADGKIGAVIKKCIEIDAKKRYNSISELKDALQNTPTNSVADRIIKKIPGIRSRHIIVVILAIIGYMALAFISFRMFASIKEGEFITILISWIFLIPVPFCCFNNFLDIWNKLPFSAGSSKRNQRITYITIGIFSILLAFFIIGTFIDSI